MEKFVEKIVGFFEEYRAEVEKVLKDEKVKGSSIERGLTNFLIDLERVEKVFPKHIETGNWEKIVALFDFLFRAIKKIYEDRYSKTERMGTLRAELEKDWNEFLEKILAVSRGKVGFTLVREKGERFWGVMRV